MLGGEYHHLRHGAPHIGHSHTLLVGQAVVYHLHQLLVLQVCPQPKLEGLPYQSTDVEHEDTPGVAGAGSTQVTLPAQHLPLQAEPHHLNVADPVHGLLEDVPTSLITYSLSGVSI